MAGGAATSDALRSPNSPASRNSSSGTAGNAARARLISGTCPCRDAAAGPGSGSNCTEFSQRLAALLPRLRFPLLRFHVVLAPNANPRTLLVPHRPQAREQTTEVADAGQCDVEAIHVRPNRISWARLLKRVFEMDMQHCPNCGEEDPNIIARVLTLTSRQADASELLLLAGCCPMQPPQ